MITKPSPRVLDALSKLEHDDRFTEIKEWLEDSLAGTFERMLLTENDIELRQQQGSAKTLKEVIDIAKNARSILKK